MRLLKIWKSAVEVERAVARLEFWLEPAEFEPARLARARENWIQIWLGSLGLEVLKFLGSARLTSQKRAKFMPYFGSFQLILAKA